MASAADGDTSDRGRQVPKRPAPGQSERSCLLAEKQLRRDIEAFLQFVRSGVFSVPAPSPVRQRLYALRQKLVELFDAQWGRSQIARTRSSPNTRSFGSVLPTTGKSDSLIAGENVDPEEVSFRLLCE